MADQITLLYDPLRGFRIFNISEIWLGPNSSGTGRVVVNIDDLVVDYLKGFFRVISVDTTPPSLGVSPSYTPVLTMVDFSSLTQQGSALRLAPYQPSVLELAFLNTDVVPFTISIDDRYRCYGTEAAFVKLFKGTDLSTQGGVVISQVFNGSGNYVSENVELELVDPNNQAIKRPPVFNTDTAMYDGEVVTAVIYTQEGGVIGQHEFLIKNTNAIRGLGNNTIYITGIVLVSNMLDLTHSDLINVPANIPFTGGDFKARLLYSDGSTSLIAVGTNKCKLHGIEAFNTALAGYNAQVVLTYYPDSNEPTVNVSNPAVRSISNIYRIHTVSNIPDFSFKIYVVPFFDPGTLTYSNKYYLTNITYTILIELDSSQIDVSILGGGVINPNINSSAQVLLLSVIMSNVFSSGYSGYTFVQTVTINYGDMSGIGWLIDYLNTNANIYGAQAFFEFSTQGQQAISIQSGALSIEEWFARLWEPLHALYDESLGILSAPQPTHFRLKYKGALGPIRMISEYWDILLPNDFGVNWVNYDTVEIIWLKPTTDIAVYSKLGVSPVRIKNTLT